MTASKVHLGIPNAQWRVCFTEKDGHYYDLEIVDYH